MTNHPGTPYTDVMKSDKNSQLKKIDERVFYRIKILREIDRSRIDWFNEMGLKISISFSAEGSITTLTGQVIDQAHLRSILNKLWDLNFEVIEVSRLETSSSMGDQIDG
jgi:hypothetical protein